jgi:hypothetical protein
MPACKVIEEVVAKLLVKASNPFINKFLVLLLILVLNIPP